MALSALSLFTARHVRQGLKPVVGVILVDLGPGLPLLGFLVYRGFTNSNNRVFANLGSDDGGVHVAARAMALGQVPPSICVEPFVVLGDHELRQFRWFL